MTQDQPKPSAVVSASSRKDPRWMTVDELDEVLTNTPEQVFSLQVATLRYYIDTVRSEA